MLRRTALVFWAVCLVAMPCRAAARFSCEAGDFQTGHGPPPAGTPRPLWDVWLRFHEMELSQDLDALFIFHRKGLEVWCRVDDQRAFQKFNEILHPLSSRYQVGLYPTRRAADKKSEDESDPPPSLWNNDELRANLGDPFARNPMVNRDEPANSAARARQSNDLLLKQRLILFADQTIEWERKMSRLARDLPALAGAALSPETPRELRARASAVCLAHARDVDRYAQKLRENLRQALPKGTQKESSRHAQKSPPKPASPVAEASRIADSALTIARRIYRFINPRNHTVELVDLREPSLLEALKDLRKQVASFRRTIER